MTAEKGLPILPSGLFYDQGLVLSYLAGSLIALLDFRVEIARWPALLASILTIPLYYWVARKLFDERLTGLIAALLPTLDAASIAWGVRARMYSLGHLFILLTLYFFLRGFFQKPRARDRYLCLLFLVLALLSHTVGMMSLLPFALLILGGSLFYKRDWLKGAKLWQEGGLALALLIGILLIITSGQAGSTNIVDNLSLQEPAPLGIDFLRGFVDIGFGADRFDELTEYFNNHLYRIFFIPILFILGLSGYRLYRQKGQFEDAALIFLSLFILLTILEMALLLSSSWQKARYLFILNLPAYFLLASRALAQVWAMIWHQVGRWRRQDKAYSYAELPMGFAFVFILLVSFWGQETLDQVDAQSTGHYDTAFEYLAEVIQPEDKVMTFHSAAAHLFLGQVDYYANQETPLVLPEKNAAGQWLDRYTASPLIATVADLEAVLAQESKLWFVIDVDRLYSRFEAAFVDQVFAQMDWDKQFGEVYVFRRKAAIVPLAQEADQIVAVNFDQWMELKGYHLQKAASAGPIDLTLFWQAQGPYRSPQPKVFVQLRNAAGETVAQADHFIYEDLINREVWEDWLEDGQVIRDHARLFLPENKSLEDENYQIYVGFYDRTSFERPPIVEDQSGENAFIIPLRP